MSGPTPNIEEEAKARYLWGLGQPSISTGWTSPGRSSVRLSAHPIDDSNKVLYRAHTAPIDLSSVQLQRPMKTYNDEIDVELSDLEFGPLPAKKPRRNDQAPPSPLADSDTQSRRFLSQARARVFMPPRRPFGPVFNAAPRPGPLQAPVPLLPRSPTKQTQARNLASVSSIASSSEQGKSKIFDQPLSKEVVQRQLLERGLIAGMSESKFLMSSSEKTADIVERNQQP